MYLEELAIERGLSANTIAGYRNDLTRLGESLARHGQDLTTADAPSLSARLLARLWRMNCQTVS